MKDRVLVVELDRLPVRLDGALVAAVRELDVSQRVVRRRCRRVQLDGFQHSLNGGFGFGFGETLPEEQIVLGQDRINRNRLTSQLNCLLGAA